MILYYDWYGNPISDVFEWAKLMENPSYGYVRQEYIAGVFISTRWMGLTGSWQGNVGTFETMTFTDHPLLKDFDYFQVKSSSIGEAVRVHLELTFVLRDRFKQLCPASESSES